MGHPKVTALSWSPELVAEFEPSAQRNPFGVLESAREILQGSYIFEVRCGAQRALMAVRPVPIDAGGCRAEVTGLVSSGPLFHAADMDRAALMIAHQLDADVLAMTTQHHRLARACQRQGWAVTGAVLTKWAKGH